MCKMNSGGIGRVNSHALRYYFKSADGTIFYALGVPGIMTVQRLHDLAVTNIWGYECVRMLLLYF